MEKKRNSCLLAFGVALLLASTFASFLIFISLLIGEMTIPYLNSNSGANTVRLILLLSSTAGIGGGALVFALLRRRAEG